MATPALSWGRAHRVGHAELRPTSRAAAAEAAARHWREEKTPLLAYGLGRSYGDSCLNEGGGLLHMRGADRFMAFDEETGLLRCDAGVSLAEILAAFGPRGWFLPVTPGTKFVTVGGAIANDVHGKNHHGSGTFGCWVRKFELLRSDRGAVVCSAEENADLYAATIGGLGLTGVIAWADVQLRKVESLYLDAEDLRFENLHDFFVLNEASLQDWEYTVAWVDCLKTGEGLGRGIFSRANHAPARAGGLKRKAERKIAVPIDAPPGLLNGMTAKAFNAAYYRKLGGERKAGEVYYEPYFYPLDALLKWNRIYGPRGFYQFQCAVPMAAAEATITTLLERISAAGQGSFLAVLKTFGGKRSPGLLSFPMEGATLALDFPNLGEKTHKLLAALETIVAEAGGRLYPAKDGRMSAEAFQKGYPAWRDFTAHIDPGVSSSFWRRVSAEKTGAETA